MMRLARRFFRFLPAVVLLLAAGLAGAIAPRRAVAVVAGGFALEQIVPRQFAGWVPEPRIRLLDADDPDGLARELYSQVLSRAYRDADGNLVMLLLAYGPSQSERLQLHRPEICYGAAGFAIADRHRTEFNWRDGSPALAMNRLVARRGSRVEPIGYWMRIGDAIATGMLDAHEIRFRFALHGEIPDGLLFRVSSLGLPPDQAEAVQGRFIRDLLAAIDPHFLPVFVGGPVHDAG